MNLSNLLHYSNTTRIVQYIDLYSRMSPTACWKLKWISGYCIILFSLSIILNASIVYAFYKVKELRTPVNMFVLVFTVLSLIASFSEAPFVIVSNYKCKYASF